MQKSATALPLGTSRRARAGNDREAPKSLLIPYPAELLVVARHIGQYFLFDNQIGGLAERDIDQSPLGSDRIEDPRLEVDRLRGVTRERELENRHDRLLFLPHAAPMLPADLRQC